MVSLAALLTASVLAVAVAAQTPQLDSPGIDYNTVNPADRNAWCIAQGNSCRSLCYQDILHNICQQQNLMYLCECKNGTSPDLNAYTDTIPDHVCNLNQTSCISATNDAHQQDDCKSKFKCASNHPATVTKPASSTSAAASSTAAASTTAPASAAATPTAKPGAAGALRVGQEYGAPVLAAGALAAFRLLL